MRIPTTLALLLLAFAGWAQTPTETTPPPAPPPPTEPLDPATPPPPMPTPSEPTPPPMPPQPPAPPMDPTQPLPPVPPATPPPPATSGGTSSAVVQSAGQPVTVTSSPGNSISSNYRIDFAAMDANGDGHIVRS